MALGLGLMVLGAERWVFGCQIRRPQAGCDALKILCEGGETVRVGSEGVNSIRLVQWVEKGCGYRGRVGL